MTQEAILTTLTRIVRPGLGIDMVNLGTTEGIEIGSDMVTTMVPLTTESAS